MQSILYGNSAVNSRQGCGAFKSSKPFGGRASVGRVTGRASRRLCFQASGRAAAGIHFYNERRLHECSLPFMILPQSGPTLSFPRGYVDFASIISSPCRNVKAGRLVQIARWFLRGPAQIKSRGKPRILVFPGSSLGGPSGARTPDRPVMSRRL